MSKIKELFNEDNTSIKKAIESIDAKMLKYQITNKFDTIFDLIGEDLRDIEILESLSQSINEDGDKVLSFDADKGKISIIIDKEGKDVHMSFVGDKGNGYNHIQIYPQLSHPTEGDITYKCCRCNYTWTHEDDACPQCGCKEVTDIKVRLSQPITDRQVIDEAYSLYPMIYTDTEESTRMKILRDSFIIGAKWLREKGNK